MTSPRRQPRTPPRLLELSRILTLKKIQRAKRTTRAQKAAQKTIQEEKAKLNFDSTQSRKIGKTTLEKAGLSSAGNIHQRQLQTEPKNFE